MHFDYIVNDPNNEITDHASNMYLAADFDAGYQNESGARSHVGAHIFLSEDLQNWKMNTFFVVITAIIKFLMS